MRVATNGGAGNNLMKTKSTKKDTAGPKKKCLQGRVLFHSVPHLHGKQSGRPSQPSPGLATAVDVAQIFTVKPILLC